MHACGPSLKWTVENCQRVGQGVTTLSGHQQRRGNWVDHMNDTLISLSGTRWSVLSEPAVEVPWRTFDWLGSVACFGELRKGYKFCNCNVAEVACDASLAEHSRVGRARRAREGGPISSTRCVPRAMAEPQESDRELRPRWRPVGLRGGEAFAAPIFHPTDDEFANFAAYVTSIASQIGPSGIAKIVPPQSWHGPPQVPPPPTYRLAGAIAQHVVPSGNASGLYALMHETRPAMSFERFERESTAYASREQVRNEHTLDDLEDKFWAELAFARPALYGADLDGTRFAPDVKPWNLNNLPDLLRRGDGAISKPMNGINTPMLYFGAYRALFGLHVEDMDLLSINYVRPLIGLDCV